MTVALAGDIAPGATLEMSVTLAAEDPAAFFAVTVSIPDAGIAAGAV
jgi:hypothetical protein